MMTVEARTDGTARIHQDATTIIYLPGGNIFVHEDGVGTNDRYLTEHLTKDGLRTNPDYWNALYGDTQSRELIEAAWNKANRPGLFEFVDTVAQRRKEELVIASLGAGPGAETANLAMIPGVKKIYGVDFSSEACKSASERISEVKLSNAEMVNKTNIDFLEGIPNDELNFILIYGGLVENTSDVATIRKTVQLASQRLRPGGIIWGVALNQPALRGDDYKPEVATDLKGEFPQAPRIFQRLLDEMPYMFVVQSAFGIKSETHPLIAGGEPVTHGHTVERLIAVKALTPEMKMPTVGFSDALNPDWKEKYKQIIGSKITTIFEQPK